MHATIRCEVCGETILEGRYVTYLDRYGETRDDGIEGGYRQGTGRCEICGRDLCGACGDFEDGICKDCRNNVESAA